MNENDVIKAIECCCENENCRECPLAEMHSAICIKKLMNTTLDLIKRQQARIEQEVDLNREMFEKMAKDEAEIEGKKKILDSYALQYGTVTDQSKKIKEIKDEAYKEFAEEFEKRCITSGIYPIITKNILKNLVKEMTEESNGE